MKKRGMSVIVITVFIIFLSVAATVIAWMWIVPWFNEMNDTSLMTTHLTVSLEGYTVFDEEHNMVFVQVRRGSDEAEIVALDIVFEIEGKTATFRTKNAPEVNGMEMYSIDFEAEIMNEVPQFVKVAPVFWVKKKQQLGSASGRVMLPIKPVFLTESEWDVARLKARDNVLQNNVVAGIVVPDNEIIGTAIDYCKSDFDYGEIYSLTKDLNLVTSGDCFVINVNNVVLYLNDYVVNGSGFADSYAVRINANNVTVQSGNIRRFEKGIFVGGDNNKIIKNNFVDNNISVYFSSSNGNHVKDNNMTSKYFSNIFLRNSNNNLIEENRVCDARYDIYCDGGSLTGNFGEGNYFDSVELCAESWLKTSGEDYFPCS